MKQSTRRKIALAAVVVVGVVAVGYAFGPDRWIGGKERTALSGAPVRRGPLSITVTERGNLTAKDAVSLRSELEGRTTVLWLIPEGTQVEAGTVVARLDTAELLERQVQQEITLANAEAQFTKAEEAVEIQRIENESLIARAELDLQLATTELEKYREGDWPQSKQAAEEEILIAEEELKQAESTRDYSEQLEAKGFLTRSELEADQLAFNRASVKVEQARRSLELLTTYEFPKQIATLEGDVADKERELRKVRLQAESQLVDKQTDLRAAEAKLILERERFQKIEAQIEAAVLTAPIAGMVVYGREEGRWRDNDPMAEGTEVRERQEIISIPRSGGMVAEASIHESVLKQVEVGQEARLRIDALPGRVFGGEVTFVAVLPDQNSWWANPNLRLYKTEVAIDETVPEMRPGMSVAVEVLVEEVEDTLYVPLQAVHHSGGRNLCFVADDEGSHERRTVVIGRNNEAWVAIESGLSEGETVLLTPPREFLESEEEDEDDGEGPAREEESEELDTPARGDAARGAGGERSTPAVVGDVGDGDGNDAEGSARSADARGTGGEDAGADGYVAPASEETAGGGAGQ